MTPIAAVVYEDDSDDPREESDAEYLERIEREWTGVEKLEGTYPFTLDTSVRAYRLNDFLHRLVEPVHRQRFLADPETMFEEAGLALCGHDSPQGFEGQD
jgi:gallate dioxygenase